MRRWLIPALVVLVMAPIVALATGSLTMPVNFGSITSPANTAQLDTNYNAIATYVNNREITQAACATRPAASTAGRFFFCTDTQILYADTGSAWTQISPAVAGAFAQQFTGLTLSNDGTNPGTVVDIATGAATSDDAAITSRVLMVLSSAFTKTLSAWAVGTGTGCLDTATVAANTWYHVFVIERLDTSVVDVLCSTSATGPTMPSSYTKKRRLGSILTDGNTAINFFTQFGQNFIWATPSALNVNEDNEAAAFTATATSPNGVVTRARLNVMVRGFSAATQDMCVVLSALASADVAPLTTDTPLCTHAHLVSGNTGQGGGQAEVWTNTARQFRVRQTPAAAGNLVRIVTIGWDDILTP